MKRIGLILTVAALVIGVGACDFNISDPNNPPQIGPNPSQPVVAAAVAGDRKSTRLNSSHGYISYAVFCLKKKKKKKHDTHMINSTQRSRRQTQEQERCTVR